MTDASFQTLGPKSANSYLMIFVKGLGTDIIEEWVGEHAVNLFSVVQLSSIAAVKLVGESGDDDEDEAIQNMSKDLYPVVLKLLEELQKIDHEKRVELQTAFVEDASLVEAFLPLSLELAKKGSTSNPADSDSDSDSDDDKKDKKSKKGKKSKKAKKEEKIKLTKMEKKALKFERALAKKAARIEKKNEKLQAKLSKLSVSLSGTLLGDDDNSTTDDVDVNIEVSVETGETGETKEETSEEDSLLATLASTLGLDPESPVMAAVLAVASKNKVEQKDEEGATTV
jgi:hypothetical protein